MSVRHWLNLKQCWEKRKGKKKKEYITQYNSEKPSCINNKRLMVLSKGFRGGDGVSVVCMIGVSETALTLRTADGNTKVLW